MSEQIYTCSPGDLLASFVTKTRRSRTLYLLCGMSGCGKTTWCQEFVNDARKLGLQVAGLLSPAVFAGRKKIGINLLDLSSQEQRRLAVRRTPNHESSLQTKDWAFDQETLLWGNNCLQDHHKAAILIVDELGPLEFHQEAGLTAGIQLIDSRQFRLAIVTIRPSLLPIALERWPHSQIMAVIPPGNVQGGKG